ncbi:MAG TPA: hypothetical protein VK426_05790 [Methanobacterium sp.]|nr:hypothetical protein [Methanobacterium sp.]
MNIDPIEDYFEDPDRKAKLFLLIVGAQILATISIVIGTIFLILWAVGLFKF